MYGFFCFTKMLTLNLISRYYTKLKNGSDINITVVKSQRGTKNYILIPIRHSVSVFDRK